MKTVLNVKTDIEVKEKAQSLARHLGIPLSTVVNAYLKEFVQTGEFRLAREPELRPMVQKELLKATVDIKNRKNLSKTFTSTNEAAAWLNS
jgi:antitoxin component of RelBE/YafQ-DinJ toxin-antitoxin module